MIFFFFFKSEELQVRTLSERYSSDLSFRNLLKKKLDLIFCCFCFVFNYAYKKKWSVQLQHFLSHVTEFRFEFQGFVKK